MESIKSGYATISDIVFEVIADLGESGTHYFDRYLNYALRGAQEWHFDSAQEVKTVVIPMNGYNAIDFPEDYVDWVKVGIQSGDKIKTFGANDQSIALYHGETDECGNPELNSVNTECSNGYGGYYFTNVINSHGEHMGKMFGYGGGKNCLGSWKVNKERRQIQFDSTVTRTNVYFEYISNGFNPCGETVINQYGRNMLRIYIHWQRSIFKNGAASGESQKWEELFEREQRLARARVFDLSINEILELTRQNYKLSTKN
jgi:hypothetical protein